MNKYFFLFSVLFFAVGCSDQVEETEVEVVPADSNILSVSVEPATITRNGFDADGAFYWSEGDRLGVTATSSPTSFAAFDIVKGVGSRYAEFSGGIDGEIGDYAVYPFSEKHHMRIADNKLYFDLPASYVYDHVDADFFSAEQGKGNSFNAPMLGRISNGTVELKHLGGVFCIRFEQLPVGENLKLVFTSNLRLNGELEVLAGETTPIMWAIPSKTDTDNKVEISFSNARQNTSGVFYIPAGCGPYDLRIKILDGTKEIYNLPVSKNLNRGDLKIVKVGKSDIIVPDPTPDPTPDPEPTPDPDQGLVIPDANFKAYLLQEFDTDKDGKLTQEEADRVDQIYVSRKNIQSLKGIEYFRNLQVLQCYGNQLTTLDVSGCPLLFNLDCSNTGLTSLNVSGCEELYVLNCMINQLSTLDLTTCPALETLYAQNNPNLTTIYLSAGSRIPELYKDPETQLVYR